METAVRPVANPIDITVLHRIEVNVIDVALKIRIVAEGMLQIRRCQIPVSRLRNWLRDRNCAGTSPRENPVLIWLILNVRRKRHRREAVSKSHGDGPAKCRWRSFRTAGAPEPYDKPAASAR